MMHSEHKSLTPPRKDAGQMISRSTILILSGVLLGMGLGGNLTPEMQGPVMSTAVVGLISFVGLDSLARRRQRVAAQQKLDRASTRMTHRLVRHVPRPTPVARLFTARDYRTNDRSFVPVVSRQY